MKNIRNVRFKIAALVGGSVLLTLLIILILLQVISNRNLERRAKESINAYLNGSSISSDVSYDPSIIELPNGYKEGDSLLMYSDTERDIIKWCAKNEPTKAAKVRLNSRTYYVGINKVNGDDITDLVVTLIGDTALEFLNNVISFEEISSDYTVIAYIDATAELATIRRISLIILFAALLIGAVGSIEGYMIGRRLEQSAKAEKQFFENTSHELKTPLTSIRGYAEGIQTGVITDYKKTGKVITKETEKMSRLIEEILLSAKLESGAMQLHRESMELNEFVEECLMPMEGAVLSRGLDVELSLEPHKVSADPDRLEQAISNLITNALKYAKSRLSIKLEKGLLTIQNDCDYISDNDLAHLFDRFYTGEKGNTGIGLSLAKEIIELHGWKISAGRTNDGIVFAINLS
ncbi:MAG: HAMP domain-containing histidine kinase [Eubacterium sp.]|nr:HAMP domain-containing histidine kinase [Eubacterium sp.]